MKYHKIQSLYKRDPDTNFRTFLPEYSTPEIEYLAHNQWEWTEEVDGTNIRIYWNPGEDNQVVFAGRTDNSSIPAHLVNRLSEIFKPHVLLSHFDYPILLCGEGFGPKIQKVGGKYGDSVDFVLFDVYIGGLWLERKNVDDIAKKIGIQSVPVIGHGTLEEAETKARDGFKSAWGDFMAEGIVARPVVEIMARTGERVITKVKHKDFT